MSTETNNKPSSSNGNGNTKKNHNGKPITGITGVKGENMKPWYQEWIRR